MDAALDAHWLGDSARSVADAHVFPIGLQEQFVLAPHDWGLTSFDPSHPDTCKSGHYRSPRRKEPGSSACGVAGATPQGVRALPGLRTADLARRRWPYGSGSRLRKNRLAHPLHEKLHVDWLV